MKSIAHWPREIFHSIVLTIASLHVRGIVHHSLIPEHILLEHCDNSVDSEPQEFWPTPVTRICSFREACSADLSECCRDYSVHLVRYRAPELVHGMAADIFSLGTVLFFMLSGALPYSGLTDAGKPDPQTAAKLANVTNCSSACFFPSVFASVTFPFLLFTHHRSDSCNRFAPWPCVESPPQPQIPGMHDR